MFFYPLCLESSQYFFFPAQRSHEVREIKTTILIPLCRFTDVLLPFLLKMVESLKPKYGRLSSLSELLPLLAVCLFGFIFNGISVLWSGICVWVCVCNFPLLLCIICLLIYWEPFSPSRCCSGKERSIQSFPLSPFTCSYYSLMEPLSNALLQL